MTTNAPLHNQIAKEYPNDRRVNVIRANGSTYRTWESTNLLTVHGWTPSEIRVMQNLPDETIGV